MTETIQAFLDGKRKAYERKKTARRNKEAEHRVQLREFNDKICLCLDNIPLVPIKDGDTEMLKTARGIFRDWLEITKQ